MTTFDSNPMDALEALLEERRRYEGWIAQLESHGEATPARVLERVRTDYTERLRAVTRRLQGRAAELEASVDALRHRVATLRAEEDGQRDELAELELRALVGEYEPERAQQARAAAGETIARLVADRAALEGDLARMSEVLALVGAPAPAPAVPLPAAPPPAPAPPSLEAVLPEPAADPLPVPAEEPAPPPAPAAPSAFIPSALDELAFLHSVTEPTVPPASSPVATAPEPSAAAAQGGPPLTVAAALPAAEPDGPGPDLIPPPVLAAPRRPAGQPLRSSPGADAGRGAKGAALTPGTLPAVFRTPAGEHLKTLKCQECGAMNAPTEWYCEKCGGELAAM